MTLMTCTAGVMMILGVVMAYMISVENDKMSKAHSTLSYFKLDAVCAFDSLSGVYETFENRA